MQNHTLIIECMVVKNGEHAVFTTFDNGIDLHCSPSPRPVLIVVSDGKIGTVTRKTIAQKNQNVFICANTGT